MQVNFDVAEIELLLDALKKGASRHMAIARFFPKRRRDHELVARGMDELSERLRELDI